MVNTFNVHSRVLELERELISAKANFVASKTLRTKLGTVATECVTAVASAIVLSAMALGACVTSIICAVSLVTELIISFTSLAEFCVVSVIKIIEATFVACATVWAILCSLLDDLSEIKEDQMSPMSPMSPMCPRIPGAAPPPSPIPSPPSSPMISSNAGFLELRDIHDIRDIFDISGIRHVSWPVVYNAPNVYKAPIDDACRGLPYKSKEQKRAAKIARRAARF